MESVCAEEVRTLGGINIEIINRAILVDGDLALCYRINYCCRTALSVLLPIRKGKTPDERRLYDLVQSVRWWEIFDVDKTFVIDVVCYSDFFRNSHYLALTCKDAIVDQFRDQYGRRPSIHKNADIKINVFIKGQDCIISVDTSGETLFKRGYRQRTGPAPISEVLAAGMIALTGWDGKIPFVDPMCGSGTIAIEAALIQQKIPCQYWRDSFSFMHLKAFDRQVWNEVKNEANAQMVEPIDNIVARDHNRHFLNLAKSNAGENSIIGIEWQKGDFFKYVPQSKEGILVFNPPYDQRLKIDRAIEFYQKIGDQLKTHFSGWQAWILSGHMQAAKHVGLKPSRRIPLFNGSIECRLLQFELYRGSRRKTD